LGFFDLWKTIHAGAITTSKRFKNWSHIWQGATTKISEYLYVILALIGYTLISIASLLARTPVKEFRMWLH
jgi:hypothetical protein